MAVLDRAEAVIGGRYVLEDLIGEGGMGEVWRARHATLNSPVAIKFLHGASASDETSRKRFLKEAQLTARLKSRHAVRVFDHGVTEDGVPYLVMELLEGESLADRLDREGKLSPEMTVRLLRQAAHALDRAHALGIVHRDFKPENVMVLRDDEEGDEVKVLDFGIAKLVGDLEPTSTSGEIERAAYGSFTRTAGLVGTPYYMAPEQIEASSQLGPAVDVWAFGVVAFECLTSVRPFEADTIPRVLRRVIDGATPLARSIAPELPHEFDDWFRIACAKEPAARFADVHSAVMTLAVALGVADTTRRSLHSIVDIDGATPVPKITSRPPARRSSDFKETLVASANRSSIHPVIRAERRETTRFLSRRWALVAGGAALAGLVFLVGSFRGRNSAPATPMDSARVEAAVHAPAAAPPPTASAASPAAPPASQASTAAPVASGDSAAGGEQAASRDAGVSRGARPRALPKAVGAPSPPAGAAPSISPELGY
jgi:serine/threonine-protein kinase